METNLDTNSGPWSRHHGNWGQRSDEWLSESLRSEDPREVNLAAEILFRRYEHKLLGFLVNRGLPQDWLEPVAQEVWLTVCAYATANTIKGFRGLFWTIAKRRVADSFRKIEAERRIEGIVTPSGDQNVGDLGKGSPSAEDMFIEEEEWEFLCSVAWDSFILSDCERVLWLLRYHLGYSIPTMSRLMGKPRQRIDTALSKARKAVKALLVSGEYELARMPEYYELPSGFRVRSGARLIVERFSNPLVPDLTPEELKRVGLTAKELTNDYNSSLLLPHTVMRGAPSVADQCYLVLTKRHQWDDMLNNLKQATKDLRMMEQKSARFEEFSYELYCTVPDEYLIEVRVDNDSLLLRDVGAVRFIPDESAGFVRRVGLSLHEHHVTVPVVIGFDTARQGRFSITSAHGVSVFEIIDRYYNAHSTVYQGDRFQTWKEDPAVDPLVWSLRVFEENRAA